MKLYFWFLEIPWKDEPYIRFEECKVTEKPKTYKFENGAPRGLYRAFIKKDEVNHLHTDYFIGFISDKPDHKMAKKTIKNFFNRKISDLKGEIVRYESYAKAAERFGGDE